MSDVALEREVDGDLMLGDMGQVVVKTGDSSFFLHVVLYWILRLH